MALGAGGAAAAAALMPLPGEFPDEFAEFQARASTGGTVFGLLRRASDQGRNLVETQEEEEEDYSDCNFLMVSEAPKRGRSRSLGFNVLELPGTGNIPQILSGLGSDAGGDGGLMPVRTPGDGSTDSDMEQDNLLLHAYQGQPRRFSAACGDARDITAKHNIKVSISPAPSSKSFSSTSRMDDVRGDDDDDDTARADAQWGLPVYRDLPPFRRTSEADIDRLRPPEWMGVQPEPEPTTYRRRSFSITPRGGIVNEGDFLVAKFGNTVVPASSIGSDLDQQVSRSRASSFNSQGSPALSAASSCDTPTYKVLVLGATGVGKTALTQQFMTSEYMGAQNTSFDAPRGAHSRTKHNGVECTVPVCIDGEDCFLEFTDLPNPENVEAWRQAGIDAFIVVYSVTDRQSFQKSIDLLYKIRHSEGSDLAVILVANKTDLMRSRVIAEQEGKSTAGTYDIKYIEVSAAINHRVDELLVGVVKQIRLNPERLKRRRKKKKPLKKRDSEENTTGCLRKARENVLLKILNRSVGKLSKSCENLMTL